MIERRQARGGLPWRIALGLALSLCTGAPAVAGPSFDGQGRLTAVDPGRGTVTIEHGAIQGLLPATQSEFPVERAGVLQNARPGDHVRFTLRAGDESHGLLAVATLTPEAASPVGRSDHLLASIVVALGLLTLAVAAGVGIVLWREFQRLHRRVVALDHEAGMLRGLVTETQDGVGRIARALEEAATTLRVGYIQEIQRRFIRSSPATAEASGTKGSGEPTSALVVVQRGRAELYRAVEGGAAGPGFAVIWDRRRNERRRNGRRPMGHERRRSERRSSPPETWMHLGFQIVPGSRADIARTARVLRPASGERGTPR